MFALWESYKINTYPRLWRNFFWNIFSLEILQNWINYKQDMTHLKAFFILYNKQGKNRLGQSVEHETLHLHRNELLSFKSPFIQVYCTQSHQEIKEHLGSWGLSPQASKNWVETLLPIKKASSWVQVDTLGGTTEHSLHRLLGLWI